MRKGEELDRYIKDHLYNFFITESATLYCKCSFNDNLSGKFIEGNYYHAKFLKWDKTTITIQSETGNFNFNITSLYNKKSSKYSMQNYFINITKDRKEKLLKLNALKI